MDNNQIKKDSLREITEGTTKMLIGLSGLFPFTVLLLMVLGAMKILQSIWDVFNLIWGYGSIGI